MPKTRIPSIPAASETAVTVAPMALRLRGALARGAWAGATALGVTCASAVMALLPSSNAFAQAAQDGARALLAQNAPASPAAPGKASAPGAASRAAAANTDTDAEDVPPGAAVPKEKLPNVALSSEIVFEVMAAELSLQRGNLAPAYNTYIALANRTKDPRMARRAVEIALGARQLGDALIAARLWHQLDPTWRPASQLLASLQVGTGHLGEAEPLLVDELNKVPEARRGQAILELQQMIARSPERATGVDSLKRMLANDMQRPEAQLAIARSQLDAGDTAGARASLENALRIKPDYEAAALVYSQMGPSERAHAIAGLKTFLDRNPGAKEARFAYAKLLLADNQLDVAQKQFETLEKRYPHELSTLMALALLSLHAKHPEKAEQYLQKYASEAEQQNTDGAQAYVYLAQIAQDRKDYPAADKWLSKIREDSNAYLPAQIGRAQLLADQGKVEEGRALLHGIKSSDPREQLALKRAESDLLVKAKRYGDAEKLLEAEVKNHPDDPDLLYQYGMVAELNKHYDVMEKAMRRVMATQPDNAQAYNALGYSLTERNTRLPEALKLLQKASALSPEDPYIMDSLGWVKYRLGDKQQALELLRRAYGIQAQAEIGAHLGEVLWESGQQDEARKTWREALKLDGDDDTLRSTMKRYNVAP
ncbi:tetratricopeptide repeat protein [Pandoraea nosoerga]|uniref:Tetratricopeptide repeat protein n=2 Tax=Pandoraea nosoerga TaxID=2508296 RepID=A0A5E4RR58_9BURK|nr:tetratricopeptide repeat protein [Pandoraea nosoerga]MBN4674408.1 tetratricopeptide repeat protein [Pandoraea nosoerga]MBN4679676.1 tetratricopeptide repeat protein [Pandoraea nosoerga]MBN4743235.1 tetratricopeptide repeat protein [Pandoraea nosoerga]VVD64882.1 tetratricopeptide repeat protein [Pandoraea nosoerga]